MTDETKETISTTDTDLTFARYLDQWATVHKCIYTGICAEGGATWHRGIRRRTRGIRASSLGQRNACRPGSTERPSLLPLPQ